MAGQDLLSDWTEKPNIERTRVSTVLWLTSLAIGTLLDNIFPKAYGQTLPVSVNFIKPEDYEDLLEGDARKNIVRESLVIITTNANPLLASIFNWAIPNIRRSTVDLTNKSRALSRLAGILVKDNGVLVRDFSGIVELVPELKDYFKAIQTDYKKEMGWFSPLGALTLWQVENWVKIVSLK